MPSTTRSKIDAARRRVLLAAFVLVAPRAARAEPLRLRGDALVQSRSPVGLLVLRGEDRLRPWLDVETVTWLGASTEPASAGGDVLTLSVRSRHPATGSEVRAGRMVVSMGAVRPVHVDGVRGLARAFGGTTVEAFGGFPVARQFEHRDFTFTAGGRVGQAIGDVASFGGSYALRRRAAATSDEEVGADAALTPAPWLTAAARGAFDLVTRGPTDLLGSVGAQSKDVRVEVFTTHRSPGRLLPSTSLFSVLGDYAATSAGSTLRWRAFPRLEIVATGSAQARGGEAGGQGLGRATLALDEAWAGSIGLEARRVDFGGARWAGARAIVSLPVSPSLRVASEIELVRPDDPRGRGALWPWALGAIAWTSPSGWEVATALEGASGPEGRRSLHALARVSYALERSGR